VVVVAPGEEELFREEILKTLPGKHKAVDVALGGQQRQDSVYNGLMMLSPDIRYVCVHDGARPFVTPRIIVQSWIPAGKEGRRQPLSP
jgi:2-C-methyl-D-erythritol 4-phosphate cytidylyltransferase